MKFKFKKLFFAILILIFCQPKFSKAAETIYDYRKEMPISSKTSYVSIERFTTEGWIDINVLKLKTNDPFNKITPIFSKEGLSQKATLSEMMKNSKTVAAINGDFFESQKFPMALGSLYGNEKLYLSSPDVQFSRNSFALRPDFTGYVGHVGNKITIVDETSNKNYEVVAYNKMSAPYTGIQILDSNWGKLSPGKNIGENTTEILVKDNIAIDKRVGKEPFELYENSYVIVQVGDKLNEINIGDKLNLKIEGYENKIFSLGGGNILVKDGIVPTDQKFSKLKAPRSAIGVNKDATEILLVAIDGRSKRSIGMTEKEFADFMYSIGSYQALNLDGGGSTTMDILFSGDENITTVNRPSEGKERKIVTAVGITNETPLGELSYITLNLDKDEAFVNDPVKLEVKGYDQYHNRIELDPSLINYTIGGESIQNATFYPQKEGVFEINASYNDLHTSKNLTVHSDIEELKLNIDGLQISPGESYKFENIVGINKDGFRKILNPKELRFEASGEIGNFSENTFIASENQIPGAINIYYKDIVKSIPVAIGTTLQDIFDFKNADAAKIQNSSEEEIMTSKMEIAEGSDAKNFSYKISYALNPTNSSQNINVSFKEPINLLNAKFLGISVKGAGHGEKLSAEIIDENGISKIINLADNIDFSEWKYIETPIPEKMSGNIYLKNLRLNLKVSENAAIGDVYLSDLKSGVKNPYDLSFVSESSKIFMQDNFSPETWNNKISIVSNAENLSNNSNCYIFLKEIADENFNSLNAEKKIKSDKYKKEAYKDFSFYILDTNSKGIRDKDPSQWKTFLENIKSAESKNIIVISKNDPDDFADKRETKLLYETLRNAVANGKNVFLISNGSKDFAEMKDTFKKFILKDKTLNIYEAEGVSFELSASNI